MNRAERRAAAHAARKAARKAGFPPPQQQPVTSEPTPPTPEKPKEDKPMTTPSEPKPKKDISAAQLAANRLNALRSSGPSAENMHKIAQNALKHGLTGRAVVLPWEDAELYESKVLAYKEEFQPVGPEETELLQSIIDVRWRLSRVPGRESAMVEVGRRILTEQNPKLAEHSDPVTFELHIRQAFEKEFRNLHMHERQLVRRREKEMKELRELQAARKAAAAAKEAEAESTKAKPANTTTPNGFVFEKTESKKPNEPKETSKPPASPMSMPNGDTLSS